MHEDIWGEKKVWPHASLIAMHSLARNSALIVEKMCETIQHLRPLEILVKRRRFCYSTTNFQYTSF
jgi:hypothetical protein